MKKCVLSWSVALSLILGIALQSSSKSEMVDTAEWDLPRFLGHLQTAGLRFQTISARQDGMVANCAFLSEDAQASWSSFQGRLRTVGSIDAWKGSVWIERLSAQGGIDWNVEGWGVNGCQLGRFVLFGDAAMIDRIVRTLRR